MSAHLEHLNGRPMHAAAPVLELNADTALARKILASVANHLVLACDGSETAFGGFLTGQREWAMVADMSAEERQAGLSSTLREVRGFRVATQGLAARGKLKWGQQV